MSPIPFLTTQLRGTIPFAMNTLHEKYGEVVRYGPNELSYISPEAWEDIYGSARLSKTGGLVKDPKFYVPAFDGVFDL